MKQASISFGLLLFAASTQISHAQIVSSAEIFANKDAIIFVSGDLKNEGKFTSLGNLVVGGDLENQNTMKIDGQLTLNGSGVQNIKGTKNIKVGELTLQQDDYSSVRLLNGLIVDNKLSLEKGIIESFSNNPLILSENLQVTGASNQSHVKGFIQKNGEGTFTFPVGDGQNLRTITLDPNSKDALMVGYSSQNPSNISEIQNTDERIQLIGNEYWTVTPSTVEQTVRVKLINDFSTDENSNIIKGTDGRWVNTTNLGGLNNNEIKSETSIHGTTYFTVGTRVEGAGAAAVVVSPNPTNGLFNVQLNGFSADDIVKLDMIDITGKAIINQEGKVRDLSKKYNLDASNLTGDYILRVVNTSTNKIFTNKVLVVK